MSKLNHCFKIHVTTFDDHNKEQSKKVYPWFRMENKLIRSAKYRTLSAGGKLLWLWLLSEASQSRLREALVHPRDVSFDIHVKPSSVPRVIQELVDREWIQVLETPHGRTDGRTDGRTASLSGPPPSDPPSLKPSDQPKPKAAKSVEKPETLPRLAEIWNENRGPLPLVKGCGDKRRKTANQRIKEAPEDEWVLVVRKMASSEFCQGKNDREWKADFDFLLQTETRHKVLEGKYDRREKQSNALVDDRGLAVR